MSAACHEARAPCRRPPLVRGACACSVGGRRQQRSVYNPEWLDAAQSGRRTHAWSRRRAGRAAADTQRSDADVDQLPRCQGLESSEKDGYQGPERFDSVRRRDEDNNGNWEGTDVLLMLQILIRRQQGVEVARRQLQEFAVSPARPAHRCDGADIVLGQQPGKRPG